MSKSNELNVVLDALKAQLKESKKHAKGKPAEILKKILANLRISKDTDITEIVDLYAAAKGIANIAVTCTDDDDLDKKLRHFFLTRERAIKGQTQDYNSDTIANQLCRDIAKIAFPTESPNNVLMHEALTVDRAEPWMDFIEYSTDLPPIGEWFRDRANQLHLYTAVLERAITALKEGYTKQNQIWFGSDAKSVNTPLSAADLAIIKQRAPAFSRLVDYTAQLEAAIESQPKNAFDHFHELRAGLLQGDAAHAGSELQAGAAAYIAVAAFADWWNQLKPSTQNVVKGLTVRNSSYGMNRMEDILDIILDAGNERKRGAVQYCIKLKGQRLDEFINDSTIQNKLKAINEGVVPIKDVRVSTETLDSWQQKITKELKTVKPLIQQENHLYVYTQSKGIILYALMHDFFNLALLEDKNIRQAIHCWHTKYNLNRILVLDSSSQISTMIGDIYAQQDINILMLLYAHYAYKPQAAEKVLLTAIKCRLNDLSKIKHFSLAQLSKKFPFFDALTVQEEEIAYSEMVARFLQPVTKEQWQGFIPYFVHCKLEWFSPAVYRKILQHAENYAYLSFRWPGPMQDHGDAAQNDGPKIPLLDLLKKIWAEKVLRNEIASYKRIVEKRLNKRQTIQRPESLQRVEDFLNQPLATRGSNSDLVRLIEAEIYETHLSHEKGFFSRFTHSNLVQAYERALAKIDGRSPPPSFWAKIWERLCACFGRRPPYPPGGAARILFLSPPPPRPGAPGAAAFLFADVDRYIARIQAEGWQEGGSLRSFRRHVRSLVAVSAEQIALSRNAISQRSFGHSVGQTSTRSDQTIAAALNPGGISSRLRVRNRVAVPVEQIGFSRNAISLRPSGHTVGQTRIWSDQAIAAVLNRVRIPGMRPPALVGTPEQLSETRPAISSEDLETSLHASMSMTLG